jgi:hypothetical protein
MLLRSLHAHRTRSVLVHFHHRANLTPPASLRHYAVTPPLLRRHAVNPSVAIAGFTDRLLGVAEIEGEAVTVHNAIPDEVADVLMHRGDSVRLAPSLDRETPRRSVIRIGEATQGTA